MNSGRIWAALQQSAMVGADRLPVPQVFMQGVDGSAPASERALRAALTAPASSPAEQLLRASAVAAVLERAGWAPQPVPAAQAAPPAPAETRPEPEDARLLALMREVLQDGPQDLLAPMCAALDRAGLRLPHGMLVEALEQGRQSVALRPWLTPVLGERGRWLAALNPPWGYAHGVQETADPDQVWQEGSLDQRVALLHGEREADPAKARARLEASLKELGAKERLPMVQALAQGLSMDDEPLLDKLLSDRSKDVRDAAARLLSCLPGSAHCQRITGWLLPMLTRHEKTGIGNWLKSVLTKNAQDDWTIEPPEEGLQDWERDGITLQPPSWFRGVTAGVKAWWLQQFAELAPLGFWTRTLGKTPAELWAWSGRSDWKTSLRQGWLAALGYQSRFQRDEGEGWLQLLLGMQRNAQAEAASATLLAQLTPAQREAVWLAQVERDKGRLVDTILGIDNGLPAAARLSPALSARLVDEIGRATAGSGQATGNWYGYQADQALLACARRLDTGTLPRFAQLWRQARPVAPEADTPATLTPEQHDKLVRARHRPWDDERLRVRLERSVELRLALHQTLNP
ncbi:DUF5691 domain-containing protein [Pseudorhodoferax sp.]|uniref:DUF5691 domain-containing protein n=1 Tax=Pseudorhodoferax sp. TaxID=1993553 RepID=UPI0039E371D1